MHMFVKYNPHSNTYPLGSQVPPIHFYSHLYNFQWHGDIHVIFCKTCCIPDYNQIHKNQIRMLNDNNSIYSIYKVYVQKNRLTHIYELFFFLNTQCNARNWIVFWYKTSLYYKHYCSDNILHLIKNTLDFSLMKCLLHYLLASIKASISSCLIKKKSKLEHSYRGGLNFKR